MVLDNQTRRKAMSKSVFATPVAQNVAALVKDSLTVDVKSVKRVVGKDGKGKSITEDWTGTVIGYQTNPGRGTGSISVPADEWNDHIAALKAARDSQFEDATPPYEYESAEEVIAASIALEQPRDKQGDFIPDTDADVVAFATRRGKGSKPARIPMDQFDAFIEMLDSANEHLPGIVADVEKEWRATLAEAAVTGEAVAIPLVEDAEDGEDGEDAEDAEDGEDGEDAEDAEDAEDGDEE
jgi:hypothetical protein